MPEPASKTYDIAFIGSGIACTATLIALFKKLIASPPVSALHIAVIEKYSEMWKGIPYGERSSANALTITTIYDFFTDDAERETFFVWFEKHQPEIINEYKKRGGKTALKWLTNNHTALKNQNWNDVYLPRFIVGLYMQDKFDALKAEAEQNGYLILEVMKGETTAISANRATKVLTIDKGDTTAQLSAHKVVIAIGSAPEKKLINTFNQTTDVLYINNLYQHGVEETQNAIREQLASREENDRNMLIIGSNASCIELLYLIYGDEDFLNQINKITIISSSGKLPSHINYNQPANDHSPNLDLLEQQDVYTLDELIAAASKDISLHSKEAVPVPVIDKIMGKAISMLKPLDDEAKKQFYAVHGVTLAKLFRRSGTDYKKATDALVAGKKLELLKGNFIDLTYNDDKVRLTYTDTLTGEERQLTRNFSVVINSTGSQDLAQSSSKLIYNLIHQNGFSVNASGKAFVVDDTLAAAPGIYVIGPLAGGNYNKLLYFWHIENASRIMYLAGHLASTLLEKI